MNPLTLIIIMFTLFMGTMITVFSSHWLTMWIGLEMNMLAIIPILINKATPRSTEAATKYFLTQATASMILMMAITLNILDSGQWTLINPQNQLTPVLITLALIIKLGMAPFHFWVPEVTQGVPLKSGLILLTWQKLAPLSILYQISPSINPTMMMSVAILSIMVGGWGGLNQTQLRKILAYSSIAHMGWMAAIITFNPNTMVLNLIIYILMTIPMFMMFMQHSSTTTLSLSQMWNKNPLMVSTILITLMSLGGLPPLTGFIPKWIIIQELTKNGNIILPTAMAMLALLNLYFYMRLIYSSSLTMFPTTNNLKMKWQFESTKRMPLITPLIILSTMLLPLTPALSVLN
uniref:NADH-ubiquinone oxidoreductase chain 2 n=2 Tax=Oryctolagus cuniculus TaxID=9986 RepID=NU2M_RABIT|nr:NADH dehydrogenase subunit 2 [Oryctolagus cuniculus]O79428.1 RecName: Full=NADH-ubiquinone oxidoreductase chain 2; AltName: Full=NADH dehydrogenase subunit 2 [Oryctolagus cuniculus]AZM31675.1 NADH dehydrogenase subunit 2 [Oryctolagus cuniculus]QNO34260.1 NADH dehydrogenase subunit 2 [Oryctolagus cuniculus]QSQ71399.1 NADH dehydrogenase subunit 2 [Oryctolagus cuniculus]CAA04848.1 NADH dehydrogenase subunit 2 [Oryctolagus cuniculus]